MSRRARNVLAVLSFAALAGCQTKTVNPVGHCIVQPGSTTFTLAGFTSADVLFVMDDSASMAAKQESLANNFDQFINTLNGINTERVTKQLEPIEFHIAITTSSIFEDVPVANMSSPKTTATCGSDSTCHIGRPVVTPNQPFQYSCTPGDPCGDLDTNFRAGAAGCPSSTTPYPQGSFVAAAGNPKVLHFEKSLYKDANGSSGTKAQTNAINTLIAQFQQNVAVGTCGSGQEQHLQAGRLAIQKALAGTQTESGWPHENAKMVVAFVGDEDDCSNPADSVHSIVAAAASSPGADACTADAEKPIDQQKLTRVADFIDFYSGLTFSNGKKRPLGAAFIVSTTDAACGQTSLGAACVPGTCKYNGSVCGTGSCDGIAAGNRLLAVASGLRNRGADLVVGSVCDGNFGTILANIGDLLRPPNTLRLRTTPTASQVSVLRITDSSGKQRKVCKGPAPAGGSTAGYDWWFAAANTSTVPVPSAPSELVYINHASGNCELNSGESYSADFLDMVPEGGCTATSDCVDKLGGTATEWDCTGTTGTPGTCLCVSGE